MKKKTYNFKIFWCFESDYYHQFGFIMMQNTTQWTKLKNFFRIFFATLHSLLYFCRRFEGHINCLFKQFIFNEITDL